MKQSVLSTVIRCLCLSQLGVLFVQGAMAPSMGTVPDQRERVLQYPQPPGQKVAMAIQKRVMTADQAGLKGTTSSIVRSGIPGGQTTGGLTSVEFAIAPIEEETPVYHQAIFVKSDPQGNYEVALPPGKYWIGPKAKALDPVHYRPGALVLAEQVTVVTKGAFTRIDLVEVGYAP